MFACLMVTDIACGLHHVAAVHWGMGGRTGLGLCLTCSIHSNGRRKNACKDISRSDSKRTGRKGVGVWRGGSY